MGLFTSKFEKQAKLLFQVAAEWAEDDERVYRNQVALFSSEYQEATPKPIGLLKARLHSVAFVAMALRNRWGSTKTEACMEAVSAISGLAVMPLHDSGAISHEAAVSVGGPFFFQQMKLIDLELREGPSSPGSSDLSSEQLREFSVPGALKAIPKDLRISDADRLERYFSQGPVPENLTSGFRGLLESCHDALIESVGAEPYERCVWRPAQGRVVPQGVGSIMARPRFNVSFTSATFARLRMLIELQEAMR